MNELPPEILDHIFSFLTMTERLSAESCCKRFRAINRSSPWITFEDIIIRDNCNYALLDNFGHRLRRITCLSHEYNFGGRFYVCQQWIKKIGISCPNIVDLRIETSLMLASEYIAQFAITCRNLKCFALHVYKPEFLARGIMLDSDLEQLSKFASLKRLELSNFAVCSGAFFGSLSVHLKELSLRNIRSLTTSGPGWSDRCKNLVKITIHGCGNLNKDEWAWTARTVLAAKDNLRMLDLDVEVSLPKLLRDEISCCKYLTIIKTPRYGYALDAFGEICENIEEFEMYAPRLYYNRFSLLQNYIRLRVLILRIEFSWHFPWFAKGRFYLMDSREDCNAVCAEGIISLLCNCAQLKRLMVYGIAIPDLIRDRGRLMGYTYSLRNDDDNNRIEILSREN